MIEIKTEKELVEGMIAENKNQLTVFQIQEKWLSSQVILAKSGKNPIELQLGQIQSVIKEKKEFITWLERYLQDISN